LRRKDRDTIRVTASPQEDLFSDEGIHRFYSEPFRISGNSDRMGYRLENNIIEHAGDGNIIFDPTVPGSVQIPASCNPVVLMADCPTIGGHPKIATSWKRRFRLACAERPNNGAQVYGDYNRASPVPS
jgi:allophanate hydrolase subunit 2